MRREDRPSAESSSVASASSASSGVVGDDDTGTSDDNSHGNPRLSWYSALAKDFKEMSDEDRRTMDQDVRGTNEQAKARASSLLIMHWTTIGSRSIGSSSSGVSSSGSSSGSTFVPDPRHTSRLNHPLFDETVVAVERMRQEIWKRRREEEQYGEGQNIYVGHMAVPFGLNNDAVGDMKRAATPNRRTTAPVCVWDTGALSNNSNLLEAVG